MCESVEWRTASQESFRSEITHYSSSPSADLHSINQSLAFQLHFTLVVPTFSPISFPFAAYFVRHSSLFDVSLSRFFPLPASCQRIIESQHSAPLQANKKESRSAATEQSKEKRAEGEGAKRRCSRQFHSQPPGRYEVRTRSKVKSQQSIINRRNDDWINKWMIAGLLLQESESFCGPVSTLTRMLRSSEWMSYSWLMPPTNSLFVVGSNTWNPSNSFPF